MLLRLGLALFILGNVTALFRSPTYYQKKLYNKIADEKTGFAADPYPWVEQKWFTQKTDHFNPVNTATWQQKYYHNSVYSRNNSVIFLMIGGEGPESKHWVGDGDVQYLQWAKEAGAEVFDLEHRFFGDSWPIKNMNTDSLALLTTQQALADLAYFIESMNKLHGYNNPKWVTFGGSYPGSLSAWFRQKYPELTVGAVASSAPVNLQLDFYQYAMVVNDDLYLTQPGCADVVNTAFKTMLQLTTTTAGRNQLNQYFNLDPPFDANVTKLDITNFFGNVYNVFQGMTQYTYDGQSNKTHINQTDGKLCQIMTDPFEHDPVRKVYSLIRWFNGINGDNSATFGNSYWDAMKTVSTGNLTVLGEGGASARGWMWLCCNEIGFMQTTDQGRNIFGNTIPLNLFIDMCTDMFGPTITMDHVYNGNKKSQKYYGGADQYSASNVILPNGSMDPWHALGTYNANVTTGVQPLLINGTAHCSDMYPSYDGEPAALPAARATIRAAVFSYIGFTPANNTVGSTTMNMPATTTILPMNNSSQSTQASVGTSKLPFGTNTPGVSGGSTAAAGGSTGAASTSMPPTTTQSSSTMSVLTAVASVLIWSL